MANKCNSCGKFSSADGVRCTKCEQFFHRSCANIAPGIRIPTKWSCGNCNGAKRSSNAASVMTDSSQDKSFEDVPVGDDSVLNSLALQVKLLGELVAREMGSVRQELSRLNTTIADFNKRVCSIEERLDKLEMKIPADNRIEERLGNLEKRSPAEDSNASEIISQLRMELNDREQENLLNDVEIAGLDEKNGENPTKLTLLVAKKLGLSLDEHDIVSAERTGPRRIIADSAAGQRRPPRPIVVRLVRRAVRDDLLRAARVRRGADTSGIIESAQANRFYVNEHLTGSLGTRHDEFLYAMERHNVDVMILNETWLKEGEEGRAPVVPGYLLRHIPRSSEIRSRGGGVGFYIRRGLCARTLTHPNTINVEQMWLSINMKTRTSSMICLLAMISLAMGQYLNQFQSNPSQAFLQGFPSNFLGNSVGFPPQRLPVAGLGYPKQQKIEEWCSKYQQSFSNPPPPLGSGQDPATQTCGIAPPFCAKSRYRSIDGTCNNLRRPTWGIPQTPYGRLVKYKYGDGVSSFPRAVSGKELPNPREISTYLFPSRNHLDPVWNLNAQQWGQIITHDMSLTAGIAQSHKDTVTCCDDNGQLSPDAATNPLCAPILVPPTDVVHSQVGTQCMNFVRTGTTRDRGCTPPFAPAEPLSTVTAYMDASFCYGSSEGQARPIRSYLGGRLKTILRGGREWPPQDPNVTLTCESAKSPNEPCYLAGDIRVNQNPQLTVLQIIVLREHNRIADILSAINPHWDDETLYQEARRIVIAELQYINYYEYLPIFLGYENMVKNKLIYPRAHGYVNDYNPNVDPTVLDEHATAAFRHFHTLIRGYLELVSENRHLAGIVRLSDWFNRPLLLELENAFDDLTRGLTYQPQDFSDQFWDSEITQFLFKRNNTFGGDLRATDIQRGRDHGLGSYVATRAACGLSVPKTFHDMADFIPKPNIELLELLYENPEDVELVVAGSLEVNVPGAQAGPTFLCILTEQFYRTRVGDRFFFENGNDPDIAFTPSQLKSIRQGSSIARILCDNSDNIHHMQPKAFQQISHRNMPVPCEKLPAIDLSLWRDVGF